MEGGLFDDEGVPVSIHRKRDPVVVTQDEGIRADTTLQTLARLRPAFSEDGTHTAGSASQISDRAVVVVSVPRRCAAGGGQGNALIIRVPRACRTDHP